VKRLLKFRFGQGLLADRAFVRSLWHRNLSGNQFALVFEAWCGLRLFLGELAG